MHRCPWSAPSASATSTSRVCDCSEGHAHNYDHATIVISGRIRVSYCFERGGETVEGESREFGPGEAVAIRAEVRHAVKALEPDTHYLCVFSHRDFGGLVSQSYVGNVGAYS